MPEHTHAPTSPTYQLLILIPRT